MDFFPTADIFIFRSWLVVFFVAPNVLSDLSIHVFDRSLVGLFKLTLHVELPSLRKVDYAARLIDFCNVFVEKENDDWSINLARPDLFGKSIL